MKHALKYLGPFDPNFDRLKHDLETYVNKDLETKEIEEPPEGFKGVLFGYMEEGRKNPFAVRAEYSGIRINLDHPILLKSTRHLDGKGIGPKGTQMGDECATKLLQDMIKRNRELKDQLEHLGQVAGLFPSPHNFGQEKTLEFRGADEVLDASVYPEGATISVLVNAYERNPAARKACIRHYGTACSICGLDFGKRYGAVGDGFIHVHHLRPLAECAGEYSVDPINDLRPVCPNCHAVIHIGNQCRSIDEVKSFLE